MIFWVFLGAGFAVMLVGNSVESALFVIGAAIIDRLDKLIKK